MITCGALGLVVGLGLSACADEPAESCEPGSFACECFGGGLCLNGLTCVSNICITETAGDDETGDEDPSDDEGDGDGDEGDGDGDGDEGDGDGDEGDGDGDGDTGDGDGDTGDGDGDEGDGDGEPSGDPCSGPEELLYSQATDAGEGFGLLSQRLTNFMNADIELADDFTIPAQDQCWCIKEVEVRGIYGVTPPAPPQVILEISDDFGGTPGATQLSQTTLPMVPVSGDFVLAVPDEVISAGKRWIVVRPSMATTEGVWYWKLETTTSGSPAQMQDATQTLFTGCGQSWTDAANCYDPPMAPYQFSLQFDIYGVRGGADCN